MLFGRYDKRGTISAADAALIAEWLETHKPRKCPKRHAQSRYTGIGGTLEMSQGLEAVGNEALALLSGHDTVWVPPRYGDV